MLFLEYQAKSSCDMFKYSGFVCKKIVFYNTFYISTLLAT